MADRLYLPAPAPHEGPDRCRACQGRKTTGVRYEMKLPPVNIGGKPDADRAVLVVDEFCPVCGGCGRDHKHATCVPAEHGDATERYDDDELDRYDDDQLDRYGDGWEDADEDAPCASCAGRQWFPVQGFTDRTVTYLRMPCGCAEKLMVEAP